jgi:hypothetical protein
VDEQDWWYSAVSQTPTHRSLKSAIACSRLAAAINFAAYSTTNAAGWIFFCELYLDQAPSSRAA